jgi:hypothetical protein
MNLIHKTRIIEANYQADSFDLAMREERRRRKRVESKTGEGSGEDAHGRASSAASLYHLLFMQSA